MKEMRDVLYISNPKDELGLASDFLDALKQNKAKAVIYNGYICDDKIEKYLSQEIYKAIEKTKVKIIGANSCGGSGVVENRGKVFIQPGSVDATSTISEIIEKVIEQNIESKKHAISKIVVEQLGLWNEYLDSDKLVEAYYKNKILGINNLSFYSNSTENSHYYDHEITWHHSNAKGIALLDENDGLIGVARIERRVQFDGKWINELRDKIRKKYDLVIDSGKVEIKGKINYSCDWSWYISAQNEDGSTRSYSVHCGEKETNEIKSWMEHGIEELEKIPEIIRKKVG